MSYGIIKKRVSGQDQYCVISLDTGRPLSGGRYNSQAEAEEHLGELDGNPDKVRSSHLTPQEIRVVRFLVAGLSEKEAASILNISHSTLRTHVRHVEQKTGVGNRASIFLSMLLMGYLSVGDIAELQKEATIARKQLCLSTT